MGLFRTLSTLVLGFAVVLGCGTESGQSADARGSVRASGLPNACPTIDSFAAAPTRAPIGGVVALSATASDPDGDTLSFKWSATSGWVAGAENPDARFVCTATGRLTITVAASDAACTNTAVLDVTCF